MKKLIALIVGVLLLAMAPAVSVDAAPAPAATSAAAKKPFRVIASVAKHRIISSQTVFVTGTVRPLSIGSKVVLQKQYRKTGKWKRVDGDTIDASGEFNLRDTPTTSKTRWYRVVKAAGAGRTKGVSDRLKVAVERWDGRVKAQVFWDSTHNVNLYLWDSNSDEISEAAPGPTESGGQMSSTSTVGCGTTGAQETAYWPGKDAPFGSYWIVVDVPQNDPCGGGTDRAWRLEISVNGRLVKSVVGSGSRHGYGIGAGYTW